MGRRVALWFYPMKSNSFTKRIQKDFACYRFAFRKHFWVSCGEWMGREQEHMQGDPLEDQQPWRKLVGVWRRGDSRTVEKMCKHQRCKYKYVTKLLMNLIILLCVCVYFISVLTCLKNNKALCFVWVLWAVAAKMTLNTQDFYYGKGLRKGAGAWRSCDFKCRTAQEWRREGERGGWQCPQRHCRYWWVLELKLAHQGVWVSQEWVCQSPLHTALGLEARGRLSISPTHWWVSKSSKAVLGVLHSLEQESCEGILRAATYLCVHFIIQATDRP